MFPLTFPFFGGKGQFGRSLFTRIDDAIPLSTSLTEFFMRTFWKTSLALNVIWRENSVALKGLIFHFEVFVLVFLIWEPGQYSFPPPSFGVSREYICRNGKYILRDPRLLYSKLIHVWTLGWMYQTYSLLVHWFRALLTLFHLEYIELLASF